MGATHRLRRRPGVRLRRADGMKAHGRLAVSLEVERNHRRAAEAVDAVAVEENGVTIAARTVKQRRAKRRVG